jgi:hypothetical protein
MKRSINVSTVNFWLRKVRKFVLQSFIYYLSSLYKFFFDLLSLFSFLCSIAPCFFVPCKFLVPFPFLVFIHFLPAYKKYILFHLNLYSFILYWKYEVLLQCQSLANACAEYTNTEMHQPEINLQSVKLTSLLTEQINICTATKSQAAQIRLRPTDSIWLQTCCGTALL